MTEYNDGDKVTFEVTTTLVGDDGSHCLCTGDTTLSAEWLEHALNNYSVKIVSHEPNVKVFGPGSTVRLKAFPRYKYLVLEYGYVDLLHNIFKDSDSIFDSRNYELVENY